MSNNKDFKIKNGLIVGDKVGIGATSPTEKLQFNVLSNTSESIFFEDNSSGNYGFKLKYIEASNKFQIQGLEDGSQTAMFNIDRADGKVGIGTTSPSEKLSVAGHVMLEGSNQFLYLTNVGTGNSGIYVRGITDANTLRSHTTGIFTWETTGSEKMRLDSSGNLLVGTTNNLPAISNVEGIALSAGSYGGRLEASRSGGAPVCFNRVENGSVVEIKKAGTTVGKIGAVGTQSYIHGGGTDVGLYWGSNNIYPYRQAGLDDDTIDLGQSSKRFKDLYLSGAVNAANVTLTGYLRGPANFVIDPAAHGDDTGTVVIAGNLQIDGTTTTINSTTVTVDDKNVVLASGSTNKAAADGAGIAIDCGSDTDATLTYLGSGTDKWEFNKELSIKDGSSAIAFNEYSNGATIWLDGSNGDFAGGDYFNISAYGTTDLAFGYGAATKITMKSDGKLGIGTTSPAAPLDFGVTSTNQQVLLLRQNGNSRTGFSISSDYGVRAFGPSDATSTGSLFGVGEMSSGTNYLGDLFTVRYDGNVGIGTTSPGYRLEIAEDTNSTADLLLLRNSDSTYAQTWEFQSDTNKDLVITGSSGSGGVKILPGSRGLTVNTGGNDTVAHFESTDNKAVIRIADNDTTVYVSAENDRASFGHNPGLHANNINVLSSGNVGIGDASPDYKLHVNSGTTNVAAKFESTDGTAAIQFMDNTGNSEIGTTGSIFKIMPNGSYAVLEASQSSVVINNASQDVDFRVESNSNANMLFVDGGANKVGIGTNSLSRVFNVYHPTTDGAIKLETGGNASNVWSGIEFKTPTSQGFIYVPSNDSTGTMKFLPASSEVLALSNSAVVVNEQSNDVDFRVESNSYTHMLFVDGGNNAVGINNSAPGPGVKLSVLGASTAAVGWGDVSDRGFLSFDTSGNPIVRAGTGLSLKIQVNASRDVAIFGSTETVFNEPGNNQDFRVETGSNTHMLFVDGGSNRVGIGTSSLYNTLHVNGNTRIVGNLMAGTSGVSNVPAKPIHVKSSGDNCVVRIEDSTSSNLNFDMKVKYGEGFSIIDQGTGTSNNTRLHIDTSGEVGIGTTSPQQKLQVDGNIRINHPDGGGAPADTAIMELYGYEGRGVGLRLRDSVNSASGASNREWFVGSGYGASGFGIGYASSGSESSYADQNKMTIKTSGDVGIGTTSPAGKLHVKDGSAGSFTSNGSHDTIIVEGSGNTGINIFSPNTSYQYLAFGDPQSSNSGYVRYQHNTNQMVLRAGGNDTVFINGGNVGIGATSPDTPLHVRNVGNPNSGGNRTTVETVLTLDSTGHYPYTGYGVGIDFKGEDYGNTPLREYAKIQAVMTDHSSQNSSGDPTFKSALTFWTNTGGASGTLATEKMRISSDGKVGIGTTSPDSALEVVDSTNYKGVHIRGNAAPCLTFGQNLSSVAEWKLGISGFNGDSFSIGTGTGANDKLHIKDDGKVGIGTTAPTHMLHVKKDNDYAAKFGGTGGGDYSIEIGQGTNNSSAGFNATGSYGSMLFKISDSEKMRIKYDGNVGIGTNSPSAKLHIHETVSSGTGILLTNSANTAGTYSDIKWQYSYSDSSYASGIRFKQVNTSHGGQIEFFTDNTVGTYTQQMTITEDGKVGIGTSSPDTALHVVSGVGNVAMLTLENDVSSGADIGLVMKDTVENYAWSVQTDDTGNKFAISYKAGGSNPAVGGTDSKFVIDTDGDVGIGTASPSEKLEVNGNAHVTGAFTATTKSFVIDHPTKENMKLRHGSLEGPEDGVYVRGRLNGSNVIELPDYWTGLVDKDTITVNLTAIGGKQDLWVEDIVDNTIIVGSDQPIKCFYTIYGTRKDDGANDWEVEYDA